MIKLEVVGVQNLEATRLKLASVRKAFELAPKSIVHDAAIVYRRALKAAAPKKSGRMAESIGFRTVPLPIGVTAVFHANETAKFVIGGTRPHDIWAGYYTGKSDKKALYWSGADHPVPYVHHPGTRPNDFRKMAWLAAGPEVRATLRKTGSAIVKGNVLSEVL